MNDTVFRRLLGSDYDALPGTLARLHARPGRGVYHGEVAVERGTGWLSRLCGAATRLPPAGAGPIRVEIDIDPATESWIRHVAGHAMRSRLWDRAGHLCEKLGVVTFGFDLSVDRGRIEWRVARVSLLGLGLPAAAFAQVRAREFEHDGRYHFDVHARLPGVGLLVHYRGWLDVD